MWTHEPAAPRTRRALLVAAPKVVRSALVAGSAEAARCRHYLAVDWPATARVPWPLASETASRRLWSRCSSSSSGSHARHRAKSEWRSAAGSAWQPTAIDRAVGALRAHVAQVAGAPMATRARAGAQAPPSPTARRHRFARTFERLPDVARSNRDRERAPISFLDAKRAPQQRPSLRAYMRRPAQSFPRCYDCPSPRAR